MTTTHPIALSLVRELASALSADAEREERRALAIPRLLRRVGTTGVFYFDYNPDSTT